jgi:hypothetical protein
VWGTLSRGRSIYLKDDSYMTCKEAIFFATFEQIKNN